MEHFYLVTAYVDNAPRTFDGSVTVDHDDAQRLYYAIMDDIYVTLVRERNIHPIRQREISSARDRVGAVLFYHQSPMFMDAPRSSHPTF